MKELLFEISYECNLRCIHCSSIGCEGKIKIKDIPSLINLDEIDVVRLSGGEPTLIPDLNEYIKFFKDNNIKIILQTNGTSALEKYNMDVDKIWVSLYGGYEIHNFITAKNIYRTVSENILSLQNSYPITIQSAIFNKPQLLSLLLTIGSWDLNKNVKLRLFALLNQGRCNFALPIQEQLEIYNGLLNYHYPNTELTCSLDTTKCNYENKLVLKPDGTLFNCASHKHSKVLCKK